MKKFNDENMGFSFSSIVSFVSSTVTSALSAVTNVVSSAVSIGGKLVDKTILAAANQVGDVVTAVSSGDIRTITSATIGVPFKMVGTDLVGGEKLYDTFDDAVNASFNLVEKTYNATLSPAMKLHNEFMLKPMAKVVDKSLSPLIDANMERLLNEVSSLPGALASGKLTLKDLNNATAVVMADTISDIRDVGIQTIKNPGETIREVVDVALIPVSMVPVVGKDIAKTARETANTMVMGIGSGLPRVGNSLKKMSQGDFSSENLRQFGKGMIEIQAGISSGASVTTNKVMNELLRNDTIKDLDMYSGGLVSSVQRLNEASSKVAKGEKVSSTQLIFDAINVGMAYMSGGVGMAIFMATNALIDQTGMERTQAALIARAAIMAATSPKVTQAVKLAFADTAKDMAVTKGTKVVVEKTPIKDSAIVSSTIKIAATKAVGGDVKKEAIDQAVVHTAKNVPVKKDIIRSLVNVGMSNEKKDALIAEIKSRATKEAKARADVELAKEFGPQVTTDRIIKYGTKFQLKHLDQIYKEVKRIPYNVAKANVDVDMVGPNDNFIMRVGKEVARSPENMVTISTNIGKEIARSPENIAALSVKAGKEIARSPGNIADASGKVADELARSPKNISEALSKQYSVIAGKAQKEWERFISEGYKKWGKKLFEFLMAKYGVQDNYQPQDVDYIYCIDWEPPRDAVERMSMYPLVPMLGIAAAAAAALFVGAKAMG